MEAAIILICMLALVVPAALWRAFVLVKLWGWFIVPTFALPMIDYPTAMGISMVVAYLTYQTPNTKDERDLPEQLGAGLAAGFVMPLIALFFGWAIQQWMPA